MSGKEGKEQKTAGGEGRRALALFVVAWALSLPPDLGLVPAGLGVWALIAFVAPPLLLVAVAFLAMALVSLPREPGVIGVALATGVLAWVLVTGFGVGLVDLGWMVLAGGWFAATGIRALRGPFLPRALLAIAGAMASAAWIVSRTRGGWDALDAAVRTRMEDVVTLLATVLGGGDAGSEERLAQAYEAVAAEVMVFPALLAVSTVAGLAVAWWARVRLEAGSGRALPPLGRFRFPDPLVWLLIAGIALVVADLDGGWGRLGLNVAVFMGLLYALRGMAVVVGMNDGVGRLAAVLFVVGLVLAAPVILGAAMILGIGDTWIDFRGRVEAREGR